MIIDLISNCQAGDQEAMLLLLEKFTPILKKYAYKLFYEDAYDDLVTDFIIIIKNIRLSQIHNNEDGALIIYISKSIKSCFLKRLAILRNLQHIVVYSDLSEQELHQIESALATVDVYFKNDMPELNSILTESELLVINLIFISTYTVKEIADGLGVSRQSVNQVKIRALKKIQKSYWTSSNKKGN
jgi:RNA polymerase sigma factor (sigma-70 family)